MAEDHRRGGAGDAGHAVMLGSPVAAVALRLRMSGEVGGVGERLADAAPFDDGNEVEQGVAGHA